MEGAICVLSLTPKATSRGKRIKSLIAVNCIFDLSPVLAHKRADDDNGDDFCVVNRPIFLNVYKVFISTLSKKNDTDSRVCSMVQEWPSSSANKSNTLQILSANPKADMQ